jgi:hypothetical protein
MAKRKKGPTPEDWARWRENEERMERVVERALAETDPQAAARRAALFRASRGSGPEAEAALREMWRQSAEYAERVLDKIRAEEAARAEAAANGEAQSG